jgi:hypothetical protein
VGSKRSLVEEAQLMIESKVYNQPGLRSRDCCTLLTSPSHKSSAGFRKVLYVEPREVYLP